MRSKKENMINFSDLRNKYSNKGGTPMKRISCL